MSPDMITLPTSMLYTILALAIVLAITSTALVCLCVPMRNKGGAVIQPFVTVDKITARREPTGADQDRATPALEAVAERELKFRDWLRIRYRAYDHGCLTGDCPHDDADDCSAKLRADFQESERST